MGLGTTRSLLAPLRRGIVSISQALRDFSTKLMVENGWGWNSFEIFYFRIIPLVRKGGSGW